MEPLTKTQQKVEDYLKNAQILQHQNPILFLSEELDMGQSTVINALRVLKANGQLHVRIEEATDSQTFRYSEIGIY